VLLPALYTRAAQSSTAQNQDLAAKIRADLGVDASDWDFLPFADLEESVREDVRALLAKKKAVEQIALPRPDPGEPRRTRTYNPLIKSYRFCFLCTSMCDKHFTVFR